MQTPRQILIRYTLAGMLLGCCFPVIATIVVVASSSHEAAFFPAVIQAHVQQPLLWIIDMAPLVLGGMAFWVGLKQVKLMQSNHNQEQTLALRTKELILKNVRLESEVEERKQIEHALREAKETAETAARARSEFLSTMSHEIRTPLNAIIGLTGLLRETDLNDEQTEYVQTVNMSGEALLSIINDILDYSKIESGKLDLEIQSFELLEPVEDTFDLLASRAHEKSLELIYDFHENVPVHIKGDITRLRQVLVNLVSNAIKFTDAGEVFVRVRQTKREGDRCELEFAVKDTGIGIPQDRIDRLFQSFSQVDASTTRKYGGTGLGLAISKRLVELMGGRIWVESEWGRGTTFFFTIQTPATAGKDFLPHFEEGALAGRKILIVDDNDTNLKILAKRCEKWGLHVTQINHPLKALAVLRNGYRPELAILDMNMPVMDGVALASAIRSDLQPQLPMIMLSSGGSPQQAGDRDLFNSWLVKPARKRQLFQAICRACLDPGQEIAAQKPIVSAAPQPVFPLRILLAEDNLVNQKVALRMLERLGYRADVAINGLEAVLAAQNSAYDLILMDMQMPEKSGIEATQDIRSLPDETTGRPLIIAMTANATVVDKNRCLEAGMDDFIPKPVKLGDLESMIHKWFDPIAKGNAEVLRR